ncbi:hypothetical protein [Pseudomonas sp.]|uniref:hypothetical protein n=1 Tax=Pseudomonas sp. TaxID=306 RepID=UPI003D0CCE21
MEVSRTRLLALRGVAFTLDLLFLVASVYLFILFEFNALPALLYVVAYVFLAEWLFRGYTLG